MYFIRISGKPVNELFAQFFFYFFLQSLRLYILCTYLFFLCSVLYIFFNSHSDKTHSLVAAALIFIRYEGRLSHTFAPRHRALSDMSCCTSNSKQSNLLNDFFVYANWVSLQLFISSSSREIISFYATYNALIYQSIFNFKKKQNSKVAAHRYCRRVCKVNVLSLLAPCAVSHTLFNHELELN